MPGTSEMEHGELQWLHKYIPLGSLIIPTGNATVGKLVRGLDLDPERPEWLFFSHSEDGENIPTAHKLDCVSQDALLRAKVLAPYAALFHAHWIQLQLGLEVVRVYVLPYDVDRATIHRTDRKLRVAWTQLLNELNYSHVTWKGSPCSANSSSWALAAGSKSDLRSPSEDCQISLLDRFNLIPSPCPDPASVSSPDTREAMECLLSSDIPGLRTTLHDYQRRSTAVMLRREQEPSRTIDPRLELCCDHNGRHFYIDRNASLVLREARYYDNVSGGILAEEMGSGKTLICLALILTTKDEPTKAPEPCHIQIPVRRQTASLFEMAAAAVNRHAYPWRVWAEYLPNHPRPEKRKAMPPSCIEAIEKPENRAYYTAHHLEEPRRGGRAVPVVEPSRIYLSNCTLVIVPNNLVVQWQHEINKHTTGLKVVTFADTSCVIPPVDELLQYHFILFSYSRFEGIERERRHRSQGAAVDSYCPLRDIHFKRCIVDEGHSLGGGGLKWKNDLVKILEGLAIAARWVITGTPSRGLFGIEQQPNPSEARKGKKSKGKRDGDRTIQQKEERRDLERIGNITSKFLKLRPWSNTANEAGDTVAEWSRYVLQPQLHGERAAQTDCVQKTLESLIIRHRLSDISHLLPPVDEKVVVLDGSYQDKLSLNLFSMMIIANAVQSQRTDEDYFFHPKQWKNLLLLVSNLKQACFFGGSFWSADDIKKAIETAEEFLERKETPIGENDHDLLNQTIALGKVALSNKLKTLSSQYHEIPIYLENFPGNEGVNWSIDGKGAHGEPVCTLSGLVQSLQRYLHPCLDAPVSLELMIENGRLAKHGISAVKAALATATDSTTEETRKSGSSQGLAGNTSFGQDYHTIPKSAALPGSTLDETERGLHGNSIQIAAPLAKTQIISTISAKLSYLIDSIVKHQDEEQIIVFYENDNVAYYLAGVLEILHIQHLIYSRVGITSERRAQYIATFTNNPAFRVMLMDISQAAFGLDMRSASRIYFISPVLNPQVAAQAIGRARRISQSRRVTVETLVLRDSIEEVLITRRGELSPEEHLKVKSILDDQVMYDWIRDAKILPLDDISGEGVEQTTRLAQPQIVFGRGFGRIIHPDEGLVKGSIEAKGIVLPLSTAGSVREQDPFRGARISPAIAQLLKSSLKRPHGTPVPPSSDSASMSEPAKANENDNGERPVQKRTRIAFAED